MVWPSAHIANYRVFNLLLGFWGDADRLQNSKVNSQNGARRLQKMNVYIYICMCTCLYDISCLECELGASKMPDVLIL